MKILKSLCITILLITMMVSCSKKESVYKRTFFRMDTLIEVTFTSHKKINKKAIWSEIDTLLKEWEMRFSLTSSVSEMLNVNNRTNASVPISKELGEMIQTAQKYSDSLNGNFDFTILPLKKIWGLAEDSPENMPLPNKGQIDSACKLVNYKNVKLSKSLDSLYFNSPETKVDAGGIAKVFALLKVIKILEKNSIKNYLVNGGGDIIGNGVKSDGSNWVVGIQHPRKSDKMLAAFRLKKKSVFTSGDYERFRIVDNIRIHHIFNPHTGYSATGNQHVTIYGPDPIENKFLSTGLFPLPAESIIAYVNKRPHLDCVVVDSTGKTFVSEKWKSGLKITE